ncbi:MAG TPA: hypothetical protein DEQ64_08870 [Lachnoclostridium sp.]|jgi:hypothetical protein|uniref:hypothetical protein n=1 Tax=Lacrimispora sp. TaxID=2719234 RepID=UPI000EDFFC35|nr:hypothetical protein [Lacrimispora sp.]HCD43829.1 hypothetical protein [Lachnoclostridium sp.]
MPEELQVLHKEIAAIKDELVQLEARSQERFVSSAELAEIMGCSRKTVCLKIQSGEIYVTRKLGDPRIPMSQFYKSDPIDLIKRKPEKLRKVSGGESIKELVFGKG